MTYQGIPSGVVQTTIYPAPYYPIYKAYQTIGGWVVLYLQDRYTSRSVDGGKVHKSRQNAYKKADRLNHPLKYAMKKYGMAQVEYDGYTATVSLDADKPKDGYMLYIQKEGMPAHFAKFYATLPEVEAEMASTHCTQPIQWQAVNPEEN